MTVHLIGSVSPPSCASFALKQTAADNLGKYDVKALDTVRENFYVDDCLKSVPTEDEAIALVKDLRHVCLEGGFRLTKWVSNCCCPVLIACREKSKRGEGVGSGQGEPTCGKGTGSCLGCGDWHIFV